MTPSPEILVQTDLPPPDSSESWHVLPCSASTVRASETRRLASADRTVRHQFQATGQPVNRTQASDAMTSRLPCCEAKCVREVCATQMLPMGVGPFAFRYKFTNITIPPKSFYAQFSPLLRKRSHAVNWSVTCTLPDLLYANRCRRVVAPAWQITVCLTLWGS